MVQFIEAHSAALDSGFQQVSMSDAMRQRLQRSNYIFSMMKTFHELNEAFPSLIDDNGNRKQFKQFLNDVQRIDRTAKAKHIGAGKDNSNKLWAYLIHLFETEIKGDKSYIIVKQYADGSLCLYSISNNPKILKTVKEK